MSEHDKEERKREYNRNAQREFRRRRKEHLKNLEQLQREQSGDKGEEIERLRQQIESLMRENDDLKSQIQSPYSTSSSDSRFTSMSSLPQFDVSAEEVVNASLGLVSPTLIPTAGGSLFSPARGSYGYVGRHSSPYSPGPQSPSEVSASGSRTGLDQRLVVIAPSDRTLVRQQLRDMFAPLLDPAVNNVPHLHLGMLLQLSQTLPKSLRPTELQIRTPHYFGIDFLPSPSLRELLIQYGDDVSRNFCMQVFNLDEASDIGQVTIWGEDSFNELAWELSPMVLTSWGWLLGRDWISRTNFWRRQRGVPELVDTEY